MLREPKTKSFKNHNMAKKYVLNVLPPEHMQTNDIHIHVFMGIPETTCGEMKHYSHLQVPWVQKEEK